LCGAGIERRLPLPWLEGRYAKGILAFSRAGKLERCFHHPSSLSSFDDGGSRSCFRNAFNLSQKLIGGTNIFLPVYQEFKLVVDPWGKDGVLRSYRDGIGLKQATIIDRLILGSRSWEEDAGISGQEFSGQT